MGSNDSHVNVPLVVRGRVTRLRQCPQTATLVCGERSAEAGNRTHVSSAYRQRNALPGSANLAYVRGRRVCPFLKPFLNDYLFFLFIYYYYPAAQSQLCLLEWADQLCPLQWLLVPVVWSVVPTSVTLTRGNKISCAYFGDSYPWSDQLCILKWFLLL